MAAFADFSFALAHGIIVEVEVLDVAAIIVVIMRDAAGVGDAGEAADALSQR